MILTAQEMYEGTLDLVNKSHTISIEPEEWQSFVRINQVNVVQRKYNELQLTQKRIDDLRALISDPQVDPVIQLPIAPNTFPLPVIVNGQPHYWLMLSTAFKINYIENVCGFTGVSGWLKSKPMREDLEYQIMDDPYNKPKDERLYHKQIADKVFLITGTPSQGVQVLYSYLKYPPDIKLVPTPVDCVLPPHMRQEIVQDCALMIIELIESGRYRSYLNEIMRVGT